MIPVIALIGRPNVGKSTLFNCLTKSRDALVSDFSGLTRDRQYGSGQYDNKPFIVIDTGGIEEAAQAGITQCMREQTEQAIAEASVLCFMVDAKSGLSADDITLAQSLRRLQKPLFLIANKTDGINPDLALSEFYQLGIGTPIAISAAQNRGTNPLLQTLFDKIHSQQSDSVKNEGLLPNIETSGIHLAIIGKPNVGKSTLVNRMLGEDRVVVYDEPGTTRDSIFIPLSRHDTDYTLIDTAGVRRKRSVNHMIEKFSIIKTLQAIKASHVAIMVIDAQQGLTDQDLHLLGFIVDEGKSLIIAFNKWDGLSDEKKQLVKQGIQRKLSFVQFAKIHFISALHGTGVGHLFESAQQAYASATQKHSPNRLTKLLHEATKQHPLPSHKGRKIKLRYAHAGGYNPPIIVLHGNQAEKLPLTYQRYLFNFFIKTLKLVGTPVRFELKTTENPYQHIRNKLTDSQVRKKRRLMKFVKSRK